MNFWVDVGAPLAPGYSRLSKALLALVTGPLALVTGPPGIFYFTSWITVNAEKSLRKPVSHSDQSQRG